MKTPNPSDAQTDLDRVLEKINEIARESAVGDYIYRGEPKHSGKVSSSLYREYRDVETEYFDIAVGCPRGNSKGGKGIYSSQNGGL